MNTKPVFHGSDIEKICEYYAENTALSVIILRSAKFYESPNYVQNIIDYSYRYLHPCKTGSCIPFGSSFLLSRP